LPTLLNDLDAWRHLPPVAYGSGQRLPAWARALAGTLPRTTAAMLELDYRHRCRSPLNAQLGAELRWVAARASRCAYSEAYAASDLRRVGVDEATIRALAGDWSRFPEPRAAALRFAQHLTEAPHAVTDDEVARLIAAYGERQVVAMVLLLAYASFQDRLVLALNLPLEAGGPLPPVDVRFALTPPGGHPAGARRPGLPVASDWHPAERVTDPDWLALDFSRLQQELQRQRARQPRIRLPVEAPGAIRWGLVCSTYQPELAAAWSACTRAFSTEADQDPGFEQGLFWVVSRALECFY
jgi:alkylhydroperoxidase family enzyme